MNSHDFLEQSYLRGIRSGLPDEADLLFCDIQCDPLREAHYLDKMGSTTDGILMIATCDPRNTPMLTEMLRAGVNIVCLDTVPEGLEVTAVVADNYGICREALQFLLDRGHRRIAHFTEDRLFDSSLRERYDAYRDTLAEVGVTEVGPWVRQFEFDLACDPTGLLPAITEVFTTMMRLPDRPTALFCIHDYILSAVIRACAMLGIRIPEDLEVVSFNDCPPIVPYLPASVHRIVQQAHEMGHAAAQQLCRQLGEGRATPKIVRISPVFHPAEDRRRDNSP
jgi:DNA-binding LacI/PurR family transcriptional regulator